MITAETPGRGCGRRWDILIRPHLFIHLFIRPPARPPSQGQSILVGSCAAFLSSGGLKAHAGRFPFMYKGPLIPGDERRAAVEKGGDTGLGTLCRTRQEATGHPSWRRACQAGLGPHPGHRLRPPPQLRRPPSVSVGRMGDHHLGPLHDPIWNNASFPKNVSTAGLTSISSGPRGWTFWAWP